MRVLSNRDFRLLWFGGSISVLGSQFSLIAMPWLVLQLTGDPLALGLVMALAGIPRAGFILVGGAITDRFPPRILLLTCDWINFILTGLLAALVFTGTVQVWMLYFFSLASGLVSGFVIPAANSIAPTIIDADDLQTGNSITMGSSQLSGFLGPALAGVLIGAYTESTLGVTIALIVDSVSFAICALALGMMRSRYKPPAQSTEPIWASIGVALRYVWNHEGIRFMFIIISSVNLFFTGPLLVGVPVLADQRLAEGAQAFGILMSAYSGGGLAGFILAGVLPKLSGHRLSTLYIIVLTAFGAGLLGFGWINLTWLLAILMLVLGLGNGYIVIIVFTWIQQRTPREMLGRIMGILMLASMGLVPLSQTISGFISRWNLTGMFVISGGLTLLVALWATFQPALRGLSSEMAGD